MKKFLVEWTIEIHADTPREAAKEALKIQRDPESIAVYFKVFDPDGDETHVDLLDEE